METQPTEIQQTKLGKWLEDGKSSEAVAMYGTSIEKILTIVQSGEIISLPPDLPYQESLTQNGEKFLYFAFPINSAENVRDELIGDVELYAQKQAIEDYFFKATSIKAWWADILASLYFYKPKILVPSIKMGPPEDIVGSSNPKITDEIKSKIKDPKISGALVKASMRKGVVIYFNKVFLDNQVSQGYEDENEITVVSDRILNSDVISGIEVLSDEERKELISI